MEVNRLNGITSVPAAASEMRLHVSPELAEAVAAVNCVKFFGLDGELAPALDRQTRRTVIRLVDRKTGQVIRTLTAEYVLGVARDMDETSDQASDEDTA